MKEKDSKHDVIYQPHFIEVNNSKLHYVDEGQGSPIVFLHGVPTSSYLWRNIISNVSKHTRCIAPDLIGFGQSDQPDIAYTINDHFEYISRFIDKLNLKEITFVMHGLGSIIGMLYAEKNPLNTKAIAFYEAHIHPETDWNNLSLPVQQFSYLLDHPEQIYKAIITDNYFMKKIFPASMLHILDENTLKKYNEPFLTPQSRKPLLQYVLDLPLKKTNTKISQMISHYSNFLQKSSMPKLMFYSVPGFITPIETVKWCKNNLPRLELVDLGEELHLAQETMPERFSKALSDWYLKINFSD